MEDRALDQPVNLKDFELMAQKRLVRELFEHVATGSDDELTVKENAAAFQRIKLLPRILHDVTHRDLSTTVLGQTVAFPVMLAPVAGQRRFHPDGELAVARAAARAGVIFTVSTGSSASIEEIAAAADGPLWFQLYAYRDKAITRGLVERAEAAGYKALCITVDTPISGRREADLRNRYAYPRDLVEANLRHVGHNDLPHDLTDEELFAFASKALILPLTWDYLEWLQSFTHLPVVLKGVWRSDDARRAMHYQVAGIIISNHGGRQLDGTPATVEMIGEIVSAVDDKVEVLMDGGVRRGTDVLKALALGAKAVLIGRPYIWGLTVDGESGVTRILDLLRTELDVDMALAGCAKVAEIDGTLIRHKMGAFT